MVVSCVFETEPHKILPYSLLSFSRLFQATVRLVINYKKTQKTILRVSPRVPLRELLPAICEKCEFDPQTTVLLRNVHSEDTLDLSGSLNDFGLREVYARDTKGQNPLCVYAKCIKMTHMKSCRTGFHKVTLRYSAKHFRYTVLLGL